MTANDLNAFRPLCLQLRLRINFLELILAQESVELLSIAKSYKSRTKIIFAIQ